MALHVIEVSKFQNNKWSTNVIDSSMAQMSKDQFLQFWIISYGQD